MLLDSHIDTASKAPSHNGHRVNGRQLLIMAGATLQSSFVADRVEAMLRDGIERCDDVMITECGDCRNHARSEGGIMKDS